MKQYCPVCDCEQKVKIVRKEETYSVKGEPITIEANVCTCAKCHEEIMSLEYDSDNLRRAYEKYRVNHGLLQPETIKKIREQYNVSQVTFARIIGVGDKTIARYENGSLQDEAINNLIELSNDPKNFARLLERNGHLIAEDERKRLQESIGKAKVYIKWENRNVYNVDNTGMDDIYLKGA